MSSDAASQDQVAGLGRAARGSVDRPDGDAAVRGEHPLIVVGMHRAGTSLVARLVEQSGVSMGERQLEAGPDNPDGYFEDSDVVSFHDACLTRRGMSYADVRAGELPIRFSVAEAGEARALIEARCGHGPWGWKDPRTCLFLEAWGKLLPGARFVVPYRGPMETLASLIRRGERLAVADPAAGLRLWTAYNRCVVEFVERCPDRAVVFPARAVFTDAQAVAGMLTSVGAAVDADAIGKIARPDRFVTEPGFDGLMGLVEQIEPEAAAVLARLAALTPTGVGRSPGSTDGPMAELAGLASGSGAAAVNGLIVAALCIVDGRVASALSQHSAESLLASEREVSLENHRRAQAASESAAENFARAESAEQASKQNHERAESAERASKQNYERAESAERASKQNYERAESAERALKQNSRRAESVERRLEDQMDYAARLGSELESARGLVGDLEARLAQMETERNRYRKRWPPYAAKRVVQKARGRLARSSAAGGAARVDPSFGREARAVVLVTGLDGDEPAKHGLVEALAAQTLTPSRLVVPSEIGADGDTAAQRVTTQSWWSPDLPGLLEGAGFALVLHADSYGAGPAWQKGLLEMLAAAFASDAKLDAVVLRGTAGPSMVGSPNHMYETDSATVRGWGERALAAAFRAGPMLERFAAANAGESRNIGATICSMIDRGDKVLVAPRRFAMETEVARDEAESIGASLPEVTAGAAPIRALYVTQWLECGGADKGAIDLISRIDPGKVRFDVMTTVAARNAWAPRVARHVGEMVHLGDHLPLPAEDRFPAFLVEFVRRRGIGLVHIMHSMLACDALPQLKRELPGVKVVDQCHILEPMHIMDGGHPAYASRRFKDLFDHRTVTSEWLKRYLVDEHGIAQDDISVIYTGVDFDEEFNPAHYDAGTARQRLGIDADDPMVVFLGRLHEQKRPWLFARVAAEVSKTRPDLRARFVLYGSGPERARIEAIRAELSDPSRLVLAGEVEHSGPVLRDADLMLMLSSHEGLAYVSYEAMSMGVPQVFTRVNGQPELITPEVGVLLDLDEDDALVAAAVEAVVGLLDDRDRLGAMSAASRSRIERGFGIERMVGAYEDLYQRLVGRGAASG